MGEDKRWRRREEEWGGELLEEGLGGERKEGRMVEDVLEEEDGGRENGGA